MATATITSKGQITLPKEIRDYFHLKRGDRINFLLDDVGRVTVVPIIQDITSLKGMVPRPDVPVSLNDMRKTIRRRGSRR